jgi:hypothetical protein
MKESFLAIDPLQLDKEWLGQSELYYKYAKRLAMRKQELDNANSNLDIVSAQFDQKVRTNPKKYGIVKVSESAINNAIELMPEYSKAKHKVSEARYAVDVATAAVNALEHRKRALTLLVELHTQNYYSEPSKSASGRSSEAMGEISRKNLMKRTRYKGED